MNLSDLPPVVLEAICVYEALLILGFRSEHVFCAVHLSARTYRKTIFIELIGAPGFTIEVGARELPDEAIQEHWSTDTNVWNASEFAQIEPIWHASAVSKQVPLLAASIRAKGIIVPALAN